MIEQLFPSIGQEVGVLEHLPPFERYLLCGEILASSYPYKLEIKYGMPLETLYTRFDYNP
jgi:hypothetical protein